MLVNTAAADGTRSTVARFVDAPVIRTGTSVTTGSYGYWNDVIPDGYHWVFTPDGCCGLIPTNHGQTCVFAIGSPTLIGRDAELLARAVIDGGGSARSLRHELEQYQATRDRLSIPLFDITDRIASQEWDQPEIAELLIRLSAAMNDEVRTLPALPPIQRTTSPIRSPQHRERTSHPFTQEAPRTNTVTWRSFGLSSPARCTRSAGTPRAGGAP